MKAILIDPKNKMVSNIEIIGDLDSLQAAIGGYIEDDSIKSGLSIFVDEDARAKSIHEAFYIPGFTRDVLRGTAVLLGYTREGNSSPVPVSAVEIKTLIQWKEEA